MIPVERDAVQVEFDEARARLKVNNLKVFDDHDLGNSLTLGMGLPGGLGFPYPAIASKAPVRATVSFDVEWSGIADMAQINNSTQTFKGTFYSTGATIKWSVEQPELDFRFESETPDPGRNLIFRAGARAERRFLHVSPPFGGGRFHSRVR